MSRIRLAPFALLALVAANAHATLITIDASSYAEGTDLSHIRSDVTLSSMSNPGYRTDELGNPISPSPTQFQPIVVVPSRDDTSAMMFGHPDNGIWNGSFAYEGAAARYLNHEPGFINSFNVFRADFTSGTNFVQLFVGGCCHGDFPRVDLWDTHGDFLGTCSTPDARAEHDEGCHVVNLGDLSQSPDYSQPFLMSWTSPVANIGFLTSGGWAGGNDVRQISFNSVPEPGTFPLLIAGGLALLFLRRKHAGAT